MDPIVVIILFVAGVVAGFLVNQLLRPRPMIGPGAERERSSGGAPSEVARSETPPPPPAPAQQPAPMPQPRPGARREAKDLFGTVEEEATDERSKREAYAVPPAPEPKPEPADKQEARFTAFGPRQATVGEWASLLVYVHTPDALERARADAQRFKSEIGGEVREGRDSSPTYLARDTEITLVPECEGVQFNPQSIRLRWLEDLHRAEFRFRGDSTLAGDAGRIQVTVYVGPVIAATVRLGVLFDTPGVSRPLTGAAKPDNSSSAELYRAEQIFISYSHADSAVATACRNAYRALGYQVLIDIDELRSGQNWNDQLMRLIDRATIFQLFWSSRSAQSKYCKQEWEYALQKTGATRGEGFIRPVYWEDPLVRPPDELNHLHFAYIQLPRLAEGHEGASH